MMKKIIFMIFLWAFSPLLVSAFSAEVVIDSGKENINALEAVIHVPREVKVDKIYTGNSAILFWIKPPVYDNQSQTISFSGITPGGFTGRGVVLSFSGDLTRADLPRFTFSDVNALKNDGLGTAVPVKLSLHPTEIADDSTPPEVFKILVSSSPDSFEGKYFVSFATQDKGTGVERYEYTSTWLLPPDDDDWLAIESPMVLSKRMLFQKIYVRAVDSSGNHQTASTAGPYHYATVLTGIIMLLCVFLYLKYLKQRFLQRYSSVSLRP